MKFVKYLVVSLLVFSLLACVAGCSDTPEESSAPESTAPTTTTTTSDGKLTYTVYVKDEAGNPINGGLIQACADGSCRPTKVENGVATWRLEEADYEVYFSNLEASPDSPVTGYTYVDDTKKFYFEDGETELTIVLKAIEG